MSEQRAHKSEGESKDALRRGDRWLIIEQALIAWMTPMINFYLFPYSTAGNKRLNKPEDNNLIGQAHRGRANSANESSKPAQRRITIGHRPNTGKFSSRSL